MREPDVDLSVDDLRAVSAFNLACVEQVIDRFESQHPHDSRPREALTLVEAFARDGARRHAQRTAAVAAHRAARDVAAPASYVAMAAGDAAASAYLHPLSDATQVLHILRGPAYCVLAGLPVAQVCGLAGGRVVDVLGRYPRAASGRTEVARVVRELDESLRA